MNEIMQAAWELKWVIIAITVMAGIAYAACAYGPIDDEQIR